MNEGQCNSKNRKMGEFDHVLKIKLQEEKEIKN